MIKKILILGTLLLTACGGTSQYDESISNVKESVVTATMHMKVVMGKFAPVPDPNRNTVSMSADPVHNNSTLINFSVSHAGPGVADHGVYNTSTSPSQPNQAFYTMQNAEYDAFKALLNTPGRELQVAFTYDNTMNGQNHDIIPPTAAIIGLPTFSLVGTSPVTVSMNIRPNTHVAATDTQGPLQMDQANPNSVFTSVWVTKSTLVLPPNSNPTEGLDTFTPSTQFSNLILSSAMWSAMTLRLNNTANQNSRVTITYENNGISGDKQLLGLPVFTFVGETATRQLYVTAGTTATVAPSVITLTHDATHASNCLSALIVSWGQFEGTDNFDITSEQATIKISDSLWADMATKLNTPGRQVVMTLTYDVNNVNFVKPLVAPPTFTLL